MDDLDRMRFSRVLLGLVIVAVVAIVAVVLLTRVIASVDWANLHVAGAFLLGAALGSLATIRVMRYILGYVRRSDRDETGDR